MGVFRSAAWMAVWLITVASGAVGAREGSAAQASLAAPDTVSMNQSVEVRWDGPNLSGDTIRFVDPVTDRFTPQYVYVGNTKGGPATITAPAIPGTYELVYVSQREVLSRLPIVVAPVTATLEAPASAEINARIVVEVQGPNNRGDYLQFVDGEGAPLRGLYAYVGNHPDGSVPLRVPEEPGDYRIGYYTAKTLIGSTSIAVGAVAASLEAPESVVAGARFEVDWQGPDNPGDRLVIVAPDGVWTGSYAYTGNEPQTASLRAPEVPGDYEVLYLTGDQSIGRTTFSVADVRAALEAPPSIPAGHRVAVVWEGPGNGGDIIRFIDPVGSEDLTYGYVANGEQQTVRITAPPSAGEFELEYVTAGGRSLARRSISVTPAPVAPGRLRVLTSGTLNLTGSDAVEVILDASGSMLRRESGERRIDIAKRTLTDLVQTTIPAGTGFALRVFGHREADSCRTDLEIGLSPLEPETVSQAVAGINAMNLARTPIAASLALTARDLGQATGERIVVLLTDGEETCDGDPADAITRLRTQGADIRVNIVGFAIEDADLKETFARWARLGGGAYFDVRDESELAAALGQSINPEFVVLDSAGQAAVMGLAGQAPLPLPPGEYHVRSGGRTYPVSVVSERLATVTLD